MIKKWTIPNVLGSEKQVIQAIEKELSMFSLPPERLEDMQTVLSEAVLNAIEHGNHLVDSLNVKIVMEAQSSSVEFRVYDGNRLSVLERPIVSSFRSGQYGSTRGWGLFLITRLSDAWVWGRDEEGVFIEIVFLFEADGERR